MATKKGTNASNFARIYHLGLKRKEAPEDWTLGKLCTCIGSDLLNITATIVTIY